MNEDLRRLAERCGVATDYWDWQDRHVEVPEQTIVAVLDALGHDASSAEATRQSLRHLDLKHWLLTLPQCTVVRAGSDETVWVHVPHGEPVRVSVACEDGSVVPTAQVDRWVDPREVDGELVGEATFRLPPTLPLGWHRLVAEIGDHGRVSTEASAPLVVVPHRLEVRHDLDERPADGLTAQLYATRSRRSMGFGDLADLRALGDFAAERLGMDFVLVNPLHAPSPETPMEPSPYLPTTRRFPNPMYLSIESIPEFALLAADDRARIDELARRGRELNSSDVLDHDTVWALKLEALELLAGTELSTSRAEALDAFVTREGDALVDFARWCHERAGILDEVVLRSQWWLDEQLAHAQRACLDSGMRLGVLHDLAVGVHREGFDAESMADVLVSGGITVGAPADAYNQLGQDWNQPPFHPSRLAASGYAAYRDMLRTVLRHAGGVRVDHIIGLFRLWWIPSGSKASDGTYVRCDSEALIGILLLEASRASSGGAVVIGEDLGTVEPGVRDQMRERGILGTSVLWFERDWDSGIPLPPQRWRSLCLGSVTTHDLPPTLGYLRGVHVDIRADLGLFERDRETELAECRKERAEWVDVLRRDGLLAPDDDSDESLLVALHGFLGRTPARLRAVALPDLVGDLRPVNQPGTHREYPNWRIALSDQDGRVVLLDDLVHGRVAADRVRRLGAALGTVTP